MALSGRQLRFLFARGLLRPKGSGFKPLSKSGANPSSGIRTKQSVLAEKPKLHSKSYGGRKPGPSNMGKPLRRTPEEAQAFLDRNPTKTAISKFAYRTEKAIKDPGTSPEQKKILKKTLKTLTAGEAASTNEASPSTGGVVFRRKTKIKPKPTGMSPETATRLVQSGASSDRLARASNRLFKYQQRLTQLEEGQPQPTRRQKANQDAMDIILKGMRR